MKTALLVIRVEPEIAEALYQRREQTGVPTSEFVRRCIILALNPEPVVEKRQALPSNPVLLPIQKAEAN
jgi:hypothetical protein